MEVESSFSINEVPIKLDEEDNDLLLAIKNRKPLKFSSDHVNMSYGLKDKTLEGYDYLVFTHMETTGIDIEGIRLKYIVTRMLYLAEKLFSKQNCTKLLIDMASFHYGDMKYMDKLFYSLSSSLRLTKVRDENNIYVDLDCSRVHPLKLI